MSVYPESCTAFAGPRRIASGETRQVAAAIRRALDAGERDSVLVFDNATSRAVDFDLRGTVDDVLARIDTIERLTAPQAPDEPPAEPRGRGRPKLGVVAREVTLLPRHWDWLNAQSGGASVALRKLVETARTATKARDRIRTAQEITDRFMGAIAGDAVGYEEATRALYARDRARFESLIDPWPSDVRNHILRLALPVFESDQS